MRNFCPLPMTLVACSSNRLRLHVHLLVGQETETWSADPAPTRVQIELVEEKKRTLVGESSAPASVITLSNPSYTYGTVARFEATGIDPAGTPIVRGASVPYIIYDLANAKIPIFIARASTWSRPPDNLAHPRTHAVAIIAWQQYVISAGGEIKDGNPAIPDFYDAIAWSASKSQPALPRVPKNMVLVGTALLCIEDAGASWLDLLSDRVANEPAPAGLMYSEITGAMCWSSPTGARMSSAPLECPATRRRRSCGSTSTVS
jgi:hypothetical protein